MLSPFSVVAIDAAGATSSAVAVTVGLAPVNDPPRITLGSSASPVYLEGGKPLLPLATLELSDPDSPDLSGATIGLVAFNPLDGLTLNPGAVPLVWQYQPATGELRVSGVAPLAAYRDLLRGLSFSTRQDLTRPELRPLQLTLDDDTGSSQALTVTLALEPSILNGTAAADTLTGTLANDVINGLAGDDWLDGRAGADRMLGGSGNDTYRVDEAGDFIREDIGAGYDRVGASLSWVLAANLEELTLTGNQPLDGTGNSLDNRLYGNSAANRLVGMGGADTLSGGGGADTLTGGTGADLFTLASVNDSRPGSADLIIDFNRRHADRIKLTALDANSQKPGNQAFAFIGSAPFSGAGQLRYVYDAGAATGILSGDIDGDRLPDIQIDLIGVKIITLTDLLP
jgi:Ca2+-binding RTX toxin-like protein